MTDETDTITLELTVTEAHAVAMLLAAAKVLLPLGLTVGPVRDVARKLADAADEKIRADATEAG